MRLKSFHGATLTDAMRMVREALGENAIIVATREDENGGIRVTAAIDEPLPMGITKPIAPHPDGSEALEKIAEALTRHSTPQSLAEKLMAAATKFASDDPLLSLSAALDTHFKFQALDSSPIMLVGPSGAGKTLSIAKLATAATMAKKSATVISTDLERAGGVEQLAAFTRLLNIRLVETEDYHALRDVVAMQKDNPVFVDTAGRNPFNAADKQTSRELITAMGGAMLALPAGLDATEATDMALEFKSIGATRLLLTRLDTVKRMGSLLRTAYEAKLPLCCCGASNKVTEPLQPLNPVVLARIILGTVGDASKAQSSHNVKSSVYT